MKKTIITSALAIMIASASLFAADPVATVELVNQKGSSIYKVVLKSPGAGKAVLRISGKEGLMFSEVINFTNGFAFPIDFKGLANGNYTVEVLAKGTKFKKVLTVDEPKPKAYVRTTALSANRQLLTIASQKPADFTIRVLNRWNQEIFSKGESVKQSYAVVLNMAGLEPGYTVEVIETSGVVTVVK